MEDRNVSTLSRALDLAGEEFNNSFHIVIDFLLMLYTSTDPPYNSTP